jgi:hypothetical protein
MTNLSDSTRAQRNETMTYHVPFKAYLRVVPDKDGRRWTSVRDLQKLAQFIEDELVASGWNIATPVAATTQFGDSTARITLIGFVAYDADARLNIPPTDSVNLIHSGTVPGEKTAPISGDPGGGNLGLSQDPTASVDAEVALLIADLEGATSGSAYIGTVALIEVIEYNSVVYGRGGRSLPA